MVMYVRNDILDIKVFEQIKIFGEVIREQFIEPALTTRYSLRRTISKEMERRIVRIEEEKRIALNELSNYEGFVKKFGAEKAFREYKKETAVG